MTRKPDGPDLDRLDRVVADARRARDEREQGYRAHLRVIQSNGGISTVEACSKQAVNILMSGPAGAGVVSFRSTC